MEHTSNDTADCVPAEIKNMNQEDLLMVGEAELTEEFLSVMLNDDIDDIDVEVGDAEIEVEVDGVEVELEKVDGERKVGRQVRMTVRWTGERRLRAHFSTIKNDDDNGKEEDEAEEGAIKQTEAAA